MAKTQLNIKIEKKDLELIQKVASKRGETTTNFIRHTLRKELALLGFLNYDQMKALGVVPT